MCGDDVGPGLCNCTRTRFAAWSSPPPVKLVASRDGEMRDVGQGKVPEKAAVQDSHALGVRTCAVAGGCCMLVHTVIRFAARSRPILKYKTQHTRDVLDTLYMPR